MEGNGVTLMSTSAFMQIAELWSSQLVQELDKGMNSKKVYNFPVVDSHKAHFIEQNCRLSLNLLVEALKACKKFMEHPK